MLTVSMVPAHVVGAATAGPRKFCTFDLQIHQLRMRKNPMFSLYSKVVAAPFILVAFLACNYCTQGAAENQPADVAT